ncbi:hypothetical protein SAFG77S_03604 [Streptomyces afghaniensis]
MVRHRRAARVAHEDGHVVLDGDRPVEDVPVAQVAVVAFGVQIEGAQGVVGREVQGEGVVGGPVGAVGAVVLPAQSVPLPRLTAVEAEPPVAEDLPGLVGEPPVDQVEVVRGLVHHQAAAVVLLAMPAAEVVGAVPHVEQPLEVDGEHLADRSVGEQGADLLVHGVEAVVEGDGQTVAGLADGVEDAGATLGVDGHRLLGDDPAARLQRRDDVAVVLGVNGGDDDLVDVLLGEQVGEAVGLPLGGRRCAGLGQQPVVEGHPGRAGVAQRGHAVARAFGEAPGEQLGPVARADDGCAQDGISAHDR